MRHTRMKVVFGVVLAALVVVPAGGAVVETDQIDKEILIDYESEPDPVSRTIVSPRAAFEPSEGHSVVSGITDVSYVGKSANGCVTRVAWIGLKNILGSVLWRYHQKLGWCWKAGDVTSATPRCRGTWAEVYFPLWDFKGHIGCDYSGGVGQSFVRRWRQGKFQLCAAYCVQTKTPWVNVRGSATGGFSYGGGM